jgi:hypothetical protein
MCSNIPASPAYGVYISQLIRYAIILISWNVIFLTSLSLYIFTMWKCIAYNRFCRDGIYFDKILVSEYKLFKRSNKANLLIALFFLWYILQSWKLKRPQTQLRPHHFWTFTSNLTTVVNSVLKFMIDFNFEIINEGIYFDKILVSEYKPFKRSNKANLFIALVQQPVSQIKMTFQEIRIIATGPCITNQLRDVNTIVLV